MPWMVDIPCIKNHVACAFCSLSYSSPEGEWGTPARACSHRYWLTKNEALQAILKPCQVAWLVEVTISAVDSDVAFLLGMYRSAVHVFEAWEDGCLLHTITCKTTPL